MDFFAPYIDRSGSIDHNGLRLVLYWWLLGLAGGHSQKEDNSENELLDSFYLIGFKV